MTLDELEKEFERLDPNPHSSFEHLTTDEKIESYYKPIPYTKGREKGKERYISSYENSLKEQLIHRAYVIKTDPNAKILDMIDLMIEFYVDMLVSYTNNNDYKKYVVRKGLYNG